MDTANIVLGHTGLCCGMDQAMNSMLPQPMRSHHPGVSQSTFVWKTPTQPTALCVMDIPFTSHVSAGLCCGVDQAVNSMLPQPMRSDRPGSLFKHLCVESTGTASFTLFAPIGQACNVTAFHQETKKRRSWNVGTGDFIVQPLSTADNVR